MEYVGLDVHLLTRRRSAVGMNRPARLRRAVRRQAVDLSVRQRDLDQGFRDTWPTTVADPVE